MSTHPELTQAQHTIRQLGGELRLVLRTASRVETLTLYDLIRSTVLIEAFLSAMVNDRVVGRGAPDSHGADDPGAARGLPAHA